jgi:hypothetical protein
MLERARAQREGMASPTIVVLQILITPPQLDLTCGTENALLTVAELEKCEYLFTGTTPALCFMLDGNRESGKDEL